MRTIKFRGRRIDNGEWVYGYYRFRNFSKQHIIYSFKNEVAYIFEVDPSTVGQYIGTHYGDGKEMYEGDKMRSNEHKINCKIVWEKETTCYSMAWDDGKITRFRKFYDYDELEYIGNIHESVDSQGGGK